MRCLVTLQSRETGTALQVLEEQAVYEGSLILSRDEVFTDIVHYFNADMKEIGYSWMRNEPVLFNPPREWGDEQIGQCKIEEISK